MPLRPIRPRSGAARRRTACGAGRALARAAALLGLLAVATLAWAQTDELPEELRTVAAVRFRGLHHLGRRQLGQAGLRTRAPSRLPWREKPLLRHDYLRADSAAIVSLYRHYGYLDAAVAVRIERGHDPHTADVVFDVREGALTRISRVELAGLGAVSENEIRHALLAQPRRAYDPTFLQLDAVKIAALYQEHGYFPRVDTLSRRGVPDSVSVLVRYTIRQGPQYRIGDITYLPGAKVRPILGRRELLEKPGELFKRSRLDQSVERLYDTGLFRQVQTTTVPDSTRSIMDLLVGVTDRAPRWIDVGVGSGTSNLYQATGEWGHHNLDTHALEGVLDAQVARDGQNHPRTEAVTGALTEPWLFGVRLQGQTSVFYRHDHDRSDPRFVQNIEQRGFNFSLYRELSRIARVTLTQENTFAIQSYQVLKDSAGSVQDSLAQAVVPRYRTNALQLTLERDTRDDKVVPNKGSYQDLSLELAGGPLKGSSSYRKSQITSTWYTPMKNGWEFAARASAGVMEPFGTEDASFSPEIGLDPDVGRVPRESRFFVGGVNSLRGYGENSIPPSGGLAMLLTNVEWRIPLAGPFGVEIFMDSGNVWSRAEYIHGTDFVAPWNATRANDNDVRYTYGIGGRVVLPFGPLRVDLAWSDRPDFPSGGKFLGNSRVPFVYQFAIGPSF